MLIHPFKSATKDSGKLKMKRETVAEFWQKTTATGWLNPSHPGKWGANVVGLYGDDARYTKSGEKLIAIAWNCLLQEAQSA